MDLDVADLVVDQCFPEDRTGLIVALTGYFDESGTHGDSPWVTIAGWVAEPKAWKEFNRAWRAELKRVGVTEAHAKHMHGLDEEFAKSRGWTRWKVFQLRVALGRIIDAHALFGVTVSVIHDDYKQTVAASSTLPKYRDEAVSSLEDPYNFLMSVAVSMAVEDKNKRIRPKDRLAFVFDEGHNFPFQEPRSAEIVSKRFFYWMIDTDPHVAGKVVRHWSTAPSTEFPGLQAADQLAWGSNRASREDIKINLFSYKQIIIRGMYEFKTPIISGFFDRNGIRKLRMNYLGAPWPPPGT